LAPVSLPIGSPLLSLPWGGLHSLLFLSLSSSFPLFLYVSFALSSLFPLLSSSFPPYSSFTLPIPHPFSLLFIPSPFFLPHFFFLLPLALPYVPLVSDPRRVVLSDGVISADERVHRFSDMLGVHWHRDLISPAFVSIVVESHRKYLWRHPYFCFSHRPF
jgi:hypothetical protein